MIDWIKSFTKEYPGFWKEYISNFDYKSNRYVVLCVQKIATTEQDALLSIGCFGIVNDCIIIGDYFEVNFFQNEILAHNNLTSENILENKLALPEAVEKFIKYIGNATLVGYQVDIDVETINPILEKLACGRLKNEPVDLEIMHCRLQDIDDKKFTLNELFSLYKVPLTDSNSVLEEAYKMGLLFLKLKSRLGFK
jgi:DNA polymerase-3 subunit epsilon